MCGESAGVDAPYGGFKVPPRCVDLMQNGDSVDTDAIASPVRVDLCREDATIAKRMVTDYDTTLLLECDAAARFDTREDLERLAAMSGPTVPPLTSSVTTSRPATHRRDRDGGGRPRWSRRGLPARQRHPRGEGDHFFHAGARRDSVRRDSPPLLARRPETDLSTVYFGASIELANGKYRSYSY